MGIGEPAAAAGPPTKTLRFYEESGLLPPTEGAANGYRDYGMEAMSRLGLIRRGRAAGLSLAQIREVIDNRATLVRQRDRAETAEPSTCAADTTCRYV